LFSLVFFVFFLYVSSHSLSSFSSFSSFNSVHFVCLVVVISHFISSIIVFIFRTISFVKGDSGGPIVCETVEGGAFLFGATSFGGNVCGKPEWPDVWTELPFFIDWIEDKTGPLPRP
jgi:hypothetical protein